MLCCGYWIIQGSNVYELHIDVELYFGEILIDLLSGQTKKISNIIQFSDQRLMTRDHVEVNT